MDIEQATQAAASTLVSCGGEPVPLLYVLASGISAHWIDPKNPIDTDAAIREARGMIRQIVAPIINDYETAWREYLDSKMLPARRALKVEHHV